MTDWRFSVCFEERVMANRILSNTGRRILNLQMSLALLHSPVATKTQSLPNPEDDRVPFKHPALEGLANLTDVPVGEVLTKKRLAGLATQMGMQEIIRWKPRMVRWFLDPRDLRLTISSRPIWTHPVSMLFLRRHYML